MLPIWHGAGSVNDLVQMTRCHPFVGPQAKANESLQSRLLGKFQKSAVSQTKGSVLEGLESADSSSFCRELWRGAGVVGGQGPASYEAYTDGDFEGKKMSH